MTSTAVVPFFNVTRGSTLIYRCLSCEWQFCPSRLRTTRDVRMLTLAEHLRDSHQSGPLAVAA